METAVVKRFLDFFQDFIKLCQQENWPNNETTDIEIKNALYIAKHVEKCLDRLQKRDLIDEFLTTIINKQDIAHFLKTCLSDPPRYILKKIIKSEIKIEIMDKGIKFFLEIFSEQKLEACLTDLFVESASISTLFNNLPSEVPKEELIKFKSEIFLLELVACSDQTGFLQDLINNCDESTVELLVICLCNKDFKYKNTNEKILEVAIDMMLCKSSDCKKFWRHIFNVEEKYLIGMCLENESLFIYMCKALLDCGKLIQECMSTEYFYINFNYSELHRIMVMLFKYEKLKDIFMDLVKGSDGDLDFWLKFC